MTKHAKKSEPLQLVDGRKTATVEIPIPFLGVWTSIEHSFFDLCIDAGRQVLDAMMEQDREALCGPRWKRDPARRAGRAGTTTSEVTLGGRRVPIPRPRVRSTAGQEVELPSFVFAATRDPLNTHTPVMFRAGSDAWIPGSFDAGSGLLFWGTAQAKPWSRAARGTDGDALYTNSTLALDPATGELQWYFQHIPGDSHDMDETFERVLVDYDDQQSVFSMGKLGILWENDRETGELVRATDLGYQNLFDLDPRTGQAVYKDGMVQDIGEVVDFCPSTGGFKSLRAMAYHPGAKAFYIPLNLNCETAAFLPVERRPGGGGAGGVRDKEYHFRPDSPNQLGELHALDVRTGETRWRQRRKTPFNTAALTTGGGLVFVGDWERYVMAYDVETGEELWQTRLTHMTNGFPITYAVDGIQYVAIGTGSSIGGSSWATLIPALLPEKKNPRASGGIFVFALP